MVYLILGEVAQKCFTEEQREILEYQQGTIKVTIADQIKRLFGSLYLVHSPEDTYNYIAQIVHENSYLIDEIKELQERIKTIKDPGSYKKLYKSSTNNVSCSNAANNTDQLNKMSTINEYQAENESTSYSRAIASEPDKLVQQLDILKDSDKLDKLNIAKEKISFSGENIEANERFLNINREVVPKVEVVPVSDELKYHNSTFNKGGDRSLSANNTYSDNRTIGKINAKSKAVSVGKTLSNQEQDILAESLYKSLTVKIPQKRIEFGMRFYPLFTKCRIC